VALRKDWAALPVQTPAPAAAPAPMQSPPQGGRKPEANFRILGVLGRLYILMENDDGLVLVDQHAAHERILFEELRRRMETQGVPRATAADADHHAARPTRQRLGRAKYRHAAEDGRRHRGVRAGTWKSMRCRNS